MSEHKEYTVAVKFSGTLFVIVEAADKTDAIDEAIYMVETGDLCTVDSLDCDSPLTGKVVPTR